MNFRQILRRMIILFRSKADFRSKHKRTNNTLICLPKCEQLELTVVCRVCKKQMKTITHIVRLSMSYHETKRKERIIDWVHTLNTRLFQSLALFKHCVLNRAL